MNDVRDDCDYCQLTHNTPDAQLCAKCSYRKNFPRGKTAPSGATCSQITLGNLVALRLLDSIALRPIVTDVAWSRSCHKRERMNRSSCRTESGLMRPKQPCARLGPDPPRKRTLLGVMLGHGQICSRTIFSTLFARLLQRCGFWLAVCCGPGGKKWQPAAGFMTHVTVRLTAKNRDQLRNSTLGNRVWAKYIHTYIQGGSKNVSC